MKKQKTYKGAAKTIPWYQIQPEVTNTSAL